MKTVLLHFAVLLAFFTSALFMNSAVAFASGSSIGNGGRQLCIDGATEVFMESDPGGELQNRVVYTCKHGQFMNLAYHPKKIVHRGCVEGQTENWLTPNDDFTEGMSNKTYVCRGGTYQKAN